MNEFLHHDSFCRDVLSDVETFLEFMDYLASQNADLQAIINLLDMETLERIPGDFSDTANTGYADLAFRAKVKPEYLSGEKPVQVCVGFLLEHKSQKDNDVLEQLRKYHYHLMVEKLKDNAGKGIPSIAIILYNGTEKWNPLDKYDRYPKVLRDIVLPFKCVFVDVEGVADEVCLEKFSPRLGAFIVALKYARDLELHRDIFKNALERLDLEKDLDLMVSIDVYLRRWISKNFKEVFKMDFVRPPYKTIEDDEREQREALEKQREALKKVLEALERKVADRDALIADKDAKLADKDAEIAALKAKLAEMQK